MNKDKIKEIITYIIVPTAFLVISPVLAKIIDNLFISNNYIISSNVIVIISGLVLVILGSILVFWTIFLFKKYGKGTPNPTIPPKEFVVIGPYKYVRNPMALGGTIILLGEALIYYSLSLLTMTILYTVILYLNAKYIEEPELKKRFGEKYNKYLSVVPRFFPKLFNRNNKKLN